MVKRGMVTGDVCDVNHEAVIACHTRRLDPLDILDRGEAWPTDGAAGGVVSDGHEQEALLAECRSNISFDAAVPGRSPGKLPLQVARLLPRRPLSFLPFYSDSDDRFLQTALTGRRRPFPNKLTKVSAI